MKITENDVGRKVRLRNGDTSTITHVKDGVYDPYPVRISGEMWYTIKGNYIDNASENDLDIVAFADEAPTDTVPQAAQTKTLRDEFAMAAIPALIAIYYKDGEPKPAGYVAGHAIALADAMMAAREQTKESK